jgi:hypothetical protein
LHEIKIQKNDGKQKIKKKIEIKKENGGEKYG